MYLRFEKFEKDMGKNKELSNLFQAVADARMKLFAAFELVADPDVSLVEGSDPCFKLDGEEFIRSGKAAEEFDRRANALADARTAFFRALSHLPDK